MRGRLIAVNDNRVAWEYRDTNGNRKHGIADNYFEAENQLAEIEMYFNNLTEEALEMLPVGEIKCEYFESFLPSNPPSSKAANPGDGGPLCKFGPGGRYVRDYTPKDVRWIPGVWPKRILAGCRALFIVAFNGVRRRR